MTDPVSYYLISANGQKHKIDEQTVLVGRKSATCQFVIDNSEVSREHARLRVTAQGLEVKDLSSANGTFVGNQRVRTKRTLKNGDHLKFGPTEYTVLIEGSADLDETVVGAELQPAPTSAAPDNDPAKNPSVIDVMPSKQRLHPAWMGDQAQQSPAPQPPSAIENDETTPSEEEEPQQPEVEQSPVIDSPIDAQRSEPEAEPSASNQSVLSTETTKDEDASNNQEEIGKAGTIEVMPLKQNIPPAWRDDTPSETAVLRPEDLKTLNEAMQAPTFNDFDQEFDGPTLLILSGKEAGRPYRLHCSDDICFWTIGKGSHQAPSDEEISIVIEDDSVSNFHAKLVFRHGRWKIVDQMSTNHTYVNNEQHNAAFLSSGDFLRFGRVKARFLLPQSVPIANEEPSSSENKPAFARLIKKFFRSNSE